MGARPRQGPAIETVYNGKRHVVSYVSPQRPDLIVQLLLGDIILEVVAVDPRTQAQSITCSEDKPLHIPSGPGFTPYRSQVWLFRPPAGTADYWQAYYHIRVLRTSAV